MSTSLFRASPSDRPSSSVSTQSSCRTALRCRQVSVSTTRIGSTRSSYETTVGLSCDREGFSSSKEKNPNLYVRPGVCILYTIPTNSLLPFENSKPL